MIKVWTDAAEAGRLDRHGERGSTFAYQPGAPPARAVSVTMPVRLESWSAPFGLLPIFEMNLPEGVLRERFGEFREAQFASASVFKCLKRGAADARFMRECGLAELEFLSALGDLLPYRGQVQHSPSILGNLGFGKLIA